MFFNKFQTGLNRFKPAGGNGQSIIRYAVLMVGVLPFAAAFRACVPGRRWNNMSSDVGNIARGTTTTESARLVYVGNQNRSITNRRATMKNEGPRRKQHSRACWASESSFALLYNFSNTRLSTLASNITAASPSDVMSLAKQGRKQHARCLEIASAD